MGLKEAGVALIAQGAAAYFSDLKTATNATNTFVDTTDKGSGIVGRAGKAMGDAIGSVAKIAAGVGVTAFVAFGKALYDGVGDAREAAQLLGQTNAVIKSTGGAAERSAEQVTDLATALSASQGASLFGDSDVQAAENLLLTFTNIKGEVFDTATAVSVDMAQALGGAPKDQAIALGKALNDPIQGVTALTRVGVTFTDQQKEQIKTMQEAGNVAGAQQIILAELNKEFGGSAAAAAAADGGWAQFNDRLGEAKESLGAAVLPLLSSLAGVLNDQVIPIVEAGAAAFGGLVTDVEGIVGAFTDAGAMSSDFAIEIGNLAEFLGLPGNLIEDIVLATQELIGTFSSAGGASDTLGSAVDDLSGIWSHASDVIGHVMDAYQAIAMAVLPIVTKFVDAHGTEISAFFQTSYDKIISIVNLALQLYDSIVPPILHAVAGFISDHAEAIETILTGAWNVISGVVEGALTLIEGIIKVALDVIHGDWSQAWTDLQTMSASFVLSIQKVIGGFLDIIAGFFDTSMAEILQTWEDNWNMLLDIATSIDWSNVGYYVVTGILSGLRDNWDSLTSWVSDKIGDLVNSALDAIGAGSPAKEFMPVGEYSVMGIMQGFESMWPSLTALVSSMGDDLISQVADIAETVQNSIADAFGATASIDRQKAKNLETLSKMDDGFYKTATQNALNSAEEQAKAYADPAVGAKYYQMRSRQILEFQELQAKIDAETDAEKKKSLQQQQILILAAQDAERQAFEATNSRTASSLGALVKEISQLFTNKKLLDLQKQLAEAKTDAERARITELIKQASVPVNDTGVGADLMAMLRQLEIFLGLYTPPPGAPGLAGGGFAEKGQPYWVGEEGPELFWPGVNGTVMPAASSAQLAASGGNQSFDYSRHMPVSIHTNMTPAAIQQSLAIANAVLP